MAEISVPIAEKLRDIPIGIDATGMRREFDSLGEVDVRADCYWGAQTERSLHHFNIGDDRMPKAVYHAYCIVKKACALVNAAGGRLVAIGMGITAASLARLFGGVWTVVGVSFLVGVVTQMLRQHLAAAATNLLAAAGLCAFGGGLVGTLAMKAFPDTSPAGWPCG